MFSTGFTSLSVLLLFPHRSPSSSLYLVFDSISSNIDEVLSINPSDNMFVFGDFNVHHKDWLTCSGQTTLLRWLTFLLVSQTGSHSPALLDLFIFSDASICSTMAFSPLGNFDHVIVSVSIDFP